MGLHLRKELRYRIIRINEDRRLMEIVRVELADLYRNVISINRDVLQWEREGSAEKIQNNYNQMRYITTSYERSSIICRRFRIYIFIEQLIDNQEWKIIEIDPISYLLDTRNLKRMMPICLLTLPLSLLLIGRSSIFSDFLLRFLFLFRWDTKAIPAAPMTSIYFSAKEFHKPPTVRSFPYSLF